MLRRLVILARGTTALRAIHAIHDVNAELPWSRQVTAVVLHVSEDRSTRFVRDADLTVDLGPIAERPHCRVSALLRALGDAGADAVWASDWPDAEACLPEVCRTLGINLLGAAPPVPELPLPDAPSGLLAGQASVVAGRIDRLTAQLRTAVDLTPSVPVEAPSAFAAAAELRLVDCSPGRGPEVARRIRLLELPGGAGIHVEPGVSQGDAVCAWGNPILAGITAHGATLHEAVARLSRALTGTTVVADGAATNKAELLEWLTDRYPQAAGRVERSDRAGRGRIALVMAAIEAHARGLADDVDAFLDTAARGQPELGPLEGRAFHLGLDGATYRLTVLQRAEHVYQLSARSDAGATADLEAYVDRVDDHRRRLVMDGRAITVVTSAHDGFELVEVAGHPIRVEHRDGSILRSPIPAIVVAQHVAAGERVAAGTALAVLESMKLESAIRAPFDCEVGQWYVRPGSQVAYGAPLVRVEPVVGESPRPVTTGVDVLAAAIEPDVDPRPDDGDDLVGMLLGFDVDDGIASARLATYRTVSRGVPTGGEVDALTAYADLDDLFGRDMPTEHVSAGRPCSPLDAFHRYLRAPILDLAELTDEFRRRLERVSSWYGAPEPPPAEVLLRICRAHRRHDSTAKQVALAVLQRWLHELPPADGLAMAARGSVDRLCDANRVPEVRDLARAVRHMWYEQPSRTAERAGPAWTDDLAAHGLDASDTARFGLQRLELFHTDRVPASPGVLLYECRASANASDRRLVAIAEVDDTDSNDVCAVEKAVADCMASVRIARASARAVSGRLHVWIHVGAGSPVRVETLTGMVDGLAGLADDPDLEELLLCRRSAANTPRDPAAVRVTIDPIGRTPGVTVVPTLAEPLQPFDAAGLKTRAAARRGHPTPHHLGAWLAGPAGTFTELDLDDGALVPVDRGPGRNSAGIVVGRVTTPTRVYPEGVTRILLCGDPTRALGAVAEPECARIIAAIDLAERLNVPVEWFALSSGARISMDSGTENMDWVASALRRIISFTQDGHELNIVVAGINVGAQPYWNAEATMLMHTKGILIMTPASAMVLTGKRSLDFSGAVSADSESGIGGYERVMGPNGQGQYWAPDLAGAAEILMRHYDHTYIAAGEAGPRRAPTVDPEDRDVTGYPHDVPGCDFRTVGEIFSVEHNPERKKPFDIRTVMHAVVDQDSEPLERWADMADAQNAVVMDARLGGHAVCVLGVESRPTPRRGPIPADGPPIYSAGTLYPRSSKKLARAINAASGNRPLVILANLAGFDGSPDSMRNLQLEYGAEIGRAIVNFEGPIVFCVVGRYHGGAFVVFSKRLNPNLTVLAVAGARASVIGGAPAANVVLSGEARRRVRADDRIAALEADLRSISGPERLRIGLDLADLRDDVHAQKLGELAHEFDRVHDVDRAVAVGSVDAVILPHELRPAIISAVDAARNVAAARSA